MEGHTPRRNSGRQLDQPGFVPGNNDSFFPKGRCFTSNSSPRQGEEPAPQLSGLSASIRLDSLAILVAYKDVYRKWWHDDGPRRPRRKSSNGLTNPTQLVRAYLRFLLRRDDLIIRSARHQSDSIWPLSWPDIYRKQDR